MRKKHNVIPPVLCRKPWPELVFHSGDSGSSDGLRKALGTTEWWLLGTQPSAGVWGLTGVRGTEGASGWRGLRGSDPSRAPRVPGTGLGGGWGHSRGLQKVAWPFTGHNRCALNQCSQGGGWDAFIFWVWGWWMPKPGGVVFFFDISSVRFGYFLGGWHSETEWDFWWGGDERVQKNDSYRPPPQETAWKN